MRELAIDLGTATLRLLVPESPQRMIEVDLGDRARRGLAPGIDTDMPFWGRVWPSSVALARELRERDVRDKRVVELGAGLGLAGLGAASAGARVRLTDREPEALELARQSAVLNGLLVDTSPLDWNDPRDEDDVDLVVASDVLLEARTAKPLARAIRLLARRGHALIADPWAPNHPALEAAFEAEDLRFRKKVIEFDWNGVSHATVMFEVFPENFSARSEKIAER